jgi:hypothetical protein
MGSNTKPGETLLFDGQPVVIRSVEVYRANKLSDYDRQGN